MTEAARRRLAAGAALFAAVAAGPAVDIGVRRRLLPRGERPGLVSLHG